MIDTSRYMRIHTNTCEYIHTIIHTPAHTHTHTHTYIYICIYVSVMYRSCIGHVSVMYRSRIGHVLTVLTCIVHVSSARQERSRIGYVSCIYRKGQIGRVENAHVFTRIVHVSNRSIFACSERACIDMYRACIENVQFGVHVFARIVVYRKRLFESCIEFVYRGARSIHVFGIGKIHEMHARYKGKQNGGGARHNIGQTEGDTRRYTHLGETRPQ